MREEVFGDCRLILGDCREVLPSLDASLAVVSDPPYGIDFHRSGTAGYGFTGVSGAAARARGCPPIAGDDLPFDPTQLLGFSEVLIWGADHYRARLPEGGRFLAWDKLAGRASWDDFCDVEFAWHSEGGASRVFSWLWKGMVCKKQGENNGLRDHPMQKPMALMRWCLTQLKRASATVLDPYMGSGTTGVACAEIGRELIGIEIEPRWFEIACRRIEAASRQRSLPLAQREPRTEVFWVKGARQPMLFEEEG